MRRENVMTVAACKPAVRRIRNVGICPLSGKVRDERVGRHPQLIMEFAQVTCPTCFEVFDVAMPHPDEMPAEVDYDCEVCCRPMVIVFTEEDVYAKGLAD